MMYALAAYSAYLARFLGECQSTLHNFRLLRTELAGKPLGAAPEIVGVAHHQW